QIQSLGSYRGFFVAMGLSPGTTSQVIRPKGLTPFGAALKRVLLRSRVLVAEPNSKPRFIPGLFCGHGTLTWDYIPGYSAQGPHPLRGRAEARSAAQSSPGRGAKSESLGSYRGFFVAVGLLTKATPHAH